MLKEISKNDLFHLFNPARIFLGFLIVLVLANCWLNLQTRRQETQQQIISIRVLASSADNFGRFEYTVWSQHKIWQAQFPAKVLSVGDSYRVKAVMANLVVESFDQKFANYDLSLGINGQIKILEILQSSCDLECLFWQQLAQIKRQWQTYYRHTLCVTFGQINNFLSGRQCPNVFGLTNGLVFGGTDQFDTVMRQNFRTLGLSHLVAVSGFQVVLLITYLELMLNKLRLTRVWKLLASFLAIMGLILLVGPQPPVLRSGVSLLLAQSVLLFLGKKISPIRGLVYSALILLIINPFYILSVSFQLSFLASLGLILGLQNETLAGLWSAGKQNPSNKNNSKKNFSNSKLDLNNQAYELPNMLTISFIGDSDQKQSMKEKVNQRANHLPNSDLLSQKNQLTNLNIDHNNKNKSTPLLEPEFKASPALAKFQSALQFTSQLFWATVNSFIFTLPIIVNISGQVSPIAILTNLLIVPIIPILTYLNLLGMIPFLGVFPLFVAGILQSWLILLINDLARLKWLWSLSAFSGLEMLAYYLITITILGFWRFLAKRNQLKSN